ncbi:MAG TPA: GntG family PLP-dependent aldolase [Puia sp.]
MIIDLRSDTVTRPTQGMMNAMMGASVGDDVFGEDPTVNLLESRMASLFGMEAALFCASGTMSNQAAIVSHTHPGDEVICEQEAHVYIYEGGGIAFNAGCQVRPLAGNRGRILAQQVIQSINPHDVHKARTSLVCLENTSNRGGGSCYDLNEIIKIREACNSAELILHLDGARLFNALVAKNETPESYGVLFDSISVCFNKGLGCPAGSVLMGRSPFIQKARRVRKVFGGGLRQAGFLAATAIYAMDHHIERLAIDHLHAKRIETALQKHPSVQMVLPVETNLVIFEMRERTDLQHFISQLKEKEILLLPISENRLRMVTHLDITSEMVDAVVDAIPQIR